jgi:hypothetical protein
MVSAEERLSDTVSPRSVPAAESLPRPGNAAVRPAADAKPAASGWLQGEPTLIDILTDPTVDALMERDDVDPDDLVLFLQDVRAALTARHVARWLTRASGRASRDHHGDFALHAWHVPGLRRD